MKKRIQNICKRYQSYNQIELPLNLVHKAQVVINNLINQKNHLELDPKKEMIPDLQSPKAILVPTALRNQRKANPIPVLQSPKAILVQTNLQIPKAIPDPKTALQNQKAIPDPRTARQNPKAIQDPKTAL